jgi:hypothetical protein
VHLSTGGHLAKIAAHAAAGGILQHLQGGRFGSGFLAAGTTETLSPAIEHVDHVAGRILTAAMIGGTVSTLSGGKFANGAATAAFAQAFNEEIHRAEEGAHESERYGKTTANPGLQRIIIFGEPGSTNNPTYDQVVIVIDENGQTAGTFEGSSRPNPYRPNDPTIAGNDAYATVKGGEYPVELGFHKGEPALVMNGNNPVPTTAPNPNNPLNASTADYIHIHRGYSLTWRGSAGCFTINPVQWNDFISVFPQNAQIRVRVPNL